MQSIVALLLLLISLGSLAQTEIHSGSQEDGMGQVELLTKGCGVWRAAAVTLPLEPTGCPCEPAGGSVSKSVEEHAATAVVSEALPATLAWTRFEVAHDRLCGGHPADTSGHLSCQTLQSRHVRIQI